MRLRINNFVTYPTSPNTWVTLYRNKEAGHEFDENGRPWTIFTYTGKNMADGIVYTATRKYASSTEYVDIGPFPPIPEFVEEVLVTPTPTPAPANPTCANDEINDIQDCQVVPGPSPPSPVAGPCLQAVKLPIPLDQVPVFTFEPICTPVVVAGESLPLTTRDADEIEPVDVESVEVEAVDVEPVPGFSKMFVPIGEKVPKAKAAKRKLVTTKKKKRPEGEIEFRHLSGVRPGDTWTRAEEELKKVGRVDDEVYYVEKIVDIRFRSKGPEYLVKWMFWADEFNSWEDEDSFTSNDTVVKFMNERKERIKRMLEKKMNS